MPTNDPFHAVAELLNQAKADLQNAELFHEAFARTCHALSLEDVDVSNALPVDRTTVNRWRNGKSVPRPLMRKPVYKFLEGRLRERIALADSSGVSPLANLTPDDWHALAGVPEAAVEIVIADVATLDRAIKAGIVSAQAAPFQALGPNGPADVHRITTFGHGVIAAARVLVPRVEDLESEARADLRAPWV